MCRNRRNPGQPLPKMRQPGRAIGRRRTPSPVIWLPWTLRVHHDRRHPRESREASFCGAAHRLGVVERTLVRGDDSCSEGEESHASHGSFSAPTVP